jgi:hypothetical protein
VSTTDRIRYYDGEFLRAFDFGDEQTYHLEMRRRLNRYLHLYGIAQGLNLVNPTGSMDVTIMPGLAIDAYGREVYVFAPYTMGESDVTTNRITAAGTYDVWLRYQKSPGTPPSSGYGNCNQANQYTRWVESFSVSLLASPSTPFTAPGFADTDTDDPSQDQVGVLLGTVYADPTSITATFSKPLFDPKRCALLGVIAQTIQTPTSWDATQASASFSFLNAAGAPNTPLSPPASLEIKPNIFADQNLIVGPDFILTASAGTTINFNPDPTGGDTSGGNVKIAGDLFVKGNIYSPTVVGTVTTWNATSATVQQLVQQFLPEMVSGTAIVKVSAVSTATISAGYAIGVANVPIKTTRLKTVTSAIVLANFSQVQTTDRTDFDTLFNAGSGMQFSISAPASAQFTGQNGQVSVPWLVGPASGTFPSMKCAIDNFTISFVVICFP